MRDRSSSVSAECFSQKRREEVGGEDRDGEADGESLSEGWQKLRAKSHV